MSMKYSFENQPFWDIVENVALDTETLSLLDAIDDRYIWANIELQHQHDFSEQTLKSHFQHLFKRMYDMYDLPAELCNTVVDYHQNRLNNPELQHGPA